MGVVVVATFFFLPPLPIQCCFLFYVLPGTLIIFCDKLVQKFRYRAPVQSGSRLVAAAVGNLLAAPSIPVCTLVLTPAEQQAFHICSRTINGIAIIVRFGAPLAAFFRYQSSGPLWIPFLWRRKRTTRCCVSCVDGLPTRPIHSRFRTIFELPNQTACVFGTVCSWDRPGSR